MYLSISSNIAFIFFLKYSNILNNQSVSSSLLFSKEFKKFFKNGLIQLEAFSQRYIIIYRILSILLLIQSLLNYIYNSHYIKNSFNFPFLSLYRSDIFILRIFVFIIIEVAASDILVYKTLGANIIGALISGFEGQLGCIITSSVMPSFK